MPSNEYFYALAYGIAVQLIGIFGGFFILGFILSGLQGLIQANYMKALGWRGILWTAWLGTPIHELGHIFFAKLFRHKIIKVSLFKPDEATGALGEVKDSYNRFSVYQNLGNFFIGVGPLIFASFTLAALLYYLVPNQAEIFNALSISELTVFNVFGAIYKALALLFAPSNISHAGFWLFLYVSFSIASHMAPSRVDLKRAFHGLITVIILLIPVNIAILFIGFDPAAVVLKIAAYSNTFLTLMIYALAVSLVHLLLSFIIRAIARLRNSH